MKTTCCLIAIVSAVCLSSPAQLAPVPFAPTNPTNLRTKTPWHSWSALTNRLGALGAVRTNLANSMFASNRWAQLQPLGGRGTLVAKTVAERGPHHRVWRAAFAQTNQAGEVCYRTNSYTELATGMHARQPDGSWAEASDEIELTASGAAATRTQHKVTFPADISAGVIELLTPDGKLLRSRPLGICYFSPETGQNVFVGLLKSSAGVLSDRNCVTYPDCLRGDIRADLVCTVTKAGFESDLVIRAQPLAWPADYGFTNGQSVRLQLLTEFFDPPQPLKQRQWLDARAGLVDETLAFGDMTLIRGKGFPAGEPESESAVPVAKQWIEVNQRRFLLEEVSVRRIMEHLSALPKQTAAIAPQAEDPVLRRVSRERLLPKTELAGQTTNTMTMASLPGREPGFVMDWPLTLTSAANFTFKGDTTYYCGGAVNLSGTTTIEGGTVVKFASGTTPTIHILGTVDCKTGPYHPAIFTAKDDDTVGEFVEDSTGTPVGKYGNGLTLTPSGSALKHLRFCHANSAVRLNFDAGQIDLAHLQVVHCLYGVDFNGNSEDTVNLDNSLFYSITNVTKSGYDNYLRGRHLTVDYCRKLFAIGNGNHNGEVYLTNSILADVVQLGNADVYDGSNNGFYNSPQFGSARFVAAASPFQTVGAGRHYLTDASGFRAQGTTSIPGTLLDSLKTKTTQPPIEFPCFMYLTGDLTLFPKVPRCTSGAPDLGYHYDALDYTVAAMFLDGATVTVQPGTAVGFRQEYVPELYLCELWPSPWTEVGFDLRAGSTLVSRGTPTRPNIFTDVQTVQESTVWPIGACFQPDYLPNNNNLGPPVLDFRFSEFSMLACDLGCHIWGGDYTIWTEPGNGFWCQLLSWDSAVDSRMRDCTLRGGGINLGKVGDSSIHANGNISLENNLFDRTRLVLDPNWVDCDDPEVYIDLSFEAHNNLFRGGSVRLVPCSSGPNWLFKDNLFDKVAFEQYIDQPLDQDYNGYWPRTADELDAGQYAHLLVDSATPELYAVNDKLLTTAPLYQTGPFGGHYLPPSGPLYSGGSRTPSEAGFFHYTTRLDQTKEGDETGNVNIGLHYIATANGAPLDTDDDGMPDYVEDLNGDGVYESNETDHTVADLDPIHFLGLVAGSTLPPGKARIAVQVTNKLDDLIGVSLAADDLPIPGTEPLHPPFSLPLIFVVDTSRLRNGTHNFQAFATWPNLFDGATQPMKTIASESIEATINNEISFPDWHCGFGRDDQGQIVVWITAESAHPNVNYQIDMFDAYSGQYVDSISGVCAADGSIDAGWQDWYGSAAYRPVVSTFAEPGNTTLLATTVAPLKYEPVENWPALAEGQWVVAHQTFELGVQDPSPMHESMNYSGYAGWIAGGLIPDPPDPEAQSYLILQYGSQQAPRETRESQWKTLKVSLASPPARNFYYLGHGGPNAIGEDVMLYAWQVGDLLHTERYDDPQRHPYRFVFLDGCSTARGSWMRTFGIPLNNDDMAARLKYNERPAAFVGWTKDCCWSPESSPLLRVYEDVDSHGNVVKYTYPIGGHVIPEFAYYRSQFIWYWTGDLGTIAEKELWEALDKAYEDTRGAEDHVAWKEGEGLAIYGYRRLHWEQFNRGDWQSEARELLNP